MKRLFVLVLLIAFTSVACATTPPKMHIVGCQQQQTCPTTTTKAKQHFEYREFGRIALYVVTAALAFIMPFVGMRIGQEIVSD